MLPGECPGAWIISNSDVPNSIQVVTHQQIIDRGYFDLSDVIKDVQGFDISANAGRFGEFYSLRGVAGRLVYVRLSILKNEFLYDALNISAQPLLEL